MQYSKRQIEADVSLVRMILEDALALKHPHPGGAFEAISRLHPHPGGAFEAISRLHPHPGGVLEAFEAISRLEAEALRVAQAEEIQLDQTATVVEAFEAIQPLRRAERALLLHVLMQTLDKPGLFKVGLAQQLLKLPSLLQALPPDMIDLLAIALGDLRYLKHFLAGGEPSEFI